MKEITVGGRIVRIDVNPIAIGKMLHDIYTHSKKYQVNTNTETLQEKVRKPVIAKLAA